VEPSAQQLEVVKRLTAGLESSVLLSDPRGADLVIAARSSDQAIAGNALVFLTDDSPEKINELAPALAERGPLTDGLAWQGLLRRKMRHFDLNDHAPILWQGDRPLIALRTIGTHRQLMIGFDPRHSNADRLPSFAVLLLRFVESIRAGKAELEAKNMETRQPLGLAIGGEEQVVLRTEKEEHRFEPRLAASLAAPSSPGFFFVQQGAVMLLAGGARFGDLREADLSQARSIEASFESLREIALRNGRPDPLRAFWIIVGAAAALGAWMFGNRFRSGAR
jgi:hypothetical protein